MNELRIGDQIRYRGRAFRVRGFSPMSLPEQTVELADQQTGALAHVTLAQLRDLDPQDAAAGVRAAERL